jgi:AcrR family transcriptional regulator
MTRVETISVGYTTYVAYKKKNVKCCFSFCIRSRCDVLCRMPISDCDVRDPRIRRTRQLLQGALRTLLAKKGFDDLSVQDIADEATVNRATFYDHYTDKFALLEAAVAAEFHLMLHERNVKFDVGDSSAGAAIVLAVCNFLTGPCGTAEPAGERNAVEPLVGAAITNAIRRVLSAGLAQRPRKSDVSSEMIAATASGAIYGAVKEWSRTKHHSPAEAIVPTILKLVEPIFAPACAQPVRERTGTKKRVSRERAGAHR